MCISAVPLALEQQMLDNQLLEVTAPSPHVQFQDAPQEQPPAVGAPEKTALKVFLKDADKAFAAVRRAL